MIALHNHSVWSDGAMTVAELARQAKGRGFDAVGLTDHFETDKAACRYGREDVPAYLAECRAAERDHGVRVLAGCEIDLTAIVERESLFVYDFPARELNQLDFVLFEYAGTKFTWKRGPHPMRRGDRGAAGDTWQTFAAFRQLIRKPVFLAHPRFDLAFDESDEWVVAQLVARRVGLELNSGQRNRFKDAEGRSVPHYRFREPIYRAAARAGIPFITGSDVHARAEELDDSREAWEFACANACPLLVC